MAKARDAFRTISEVSDWLDTPAHVLRFWESKFTQVKPVKRAGGRRYYRPEDMQLLGGIKVLLHEQGMTIKGAQKLLREQGVKHVVGLSADPNATTAKAMMPPPAKAPEAAAPAPAPEQKSAVATPETNVTPMTAMPPPSEPVAEKPAAALEPTLALDPAIALDPTPAAEPVLPREPKAPAEPRIFAALCDANDDRLRAKAAQIAPLVARLQDVRDRMRQG